MGRQLEIQLSLHACLWRLKWCFSVGMTVSHDKALLTGLALGTLLVLGQLGLQWHFLYMYLAASLWYWCECSPLPISVSNVHQQDSWCYVVRRALLRNCHWWAGSKKMKGGCCVCGMLDLPCLADKARRSLSVSLRASLPVTCRLVVIRSDSLIRCRL